MSQQTVTARPVSYEEAASSLVRRLVHTQGDPAKQCVHQWLARSGDKRPMEFGLTPEDIATLRDAQHCAKLGQCRGMFAQSIVLDTRR